MQVRFGVNCFCLIVLVGWIFSPAGVGLAGGSNTATPVFEGLGDFGRKVTTSSPEAQRYFNQGLCFLYAFNHDEAIRSFQCAAELDPLCPMAWWGIAYANGPHINNPLVPPERAAAAWEALTKARETASHGNAVEQALIGALGTRYANPQPEDRRPLDELYAAVMRQIWKAQPDDPDVGALFAEAMMDLRPWDLWTRDGQPQPGTLEIVETLEVVLAKNLHHPLGLHLYIHAVEASPHPERALAVADRLRNLQPGLGHLVHMPSHIDVRTGRWKQAVQANAKAIVADRRYRERSPEQDFYRIYMAHNQHMLAYAAMMRGQSQLAISAINDMARGIPADWLKDNAAIADGFTAMPLEVLVRFGRWEDVLAAPEPPDYLPLARAMRLCARGIAFAATGKIDSAKREQAAFQQAKDALPEDAIFGNNKASDLLAVAALLLDGEILARAGQMDAGIAKLRESVAHEDQLRYSEPPDWIQPVRHALGATLLAAGRPEEAEAVYREDLARQPGNGWSLYGLARSLHLQNKHDEAKIVDAQFQQVWAEADVRITSSCYCQPGE
jgi:tetratricopeptide (TPR) repeat protein